ncbi:MAG TPA: radical SAM protein [Cyanobacteria bacterium UBA8530]|nr:radical SAM protein [Cyanobacteria bacterium UBA8530]
MSKEAIFSLESCFACPRRCGANRIEGKGACGAGREMKMARAALHFGEEPPISGSRGSGTIFFSHCNLNCLFCQNHSISFGGQGEEIYSERFLEILFEQEARGAHNINLVSPTQYLPQLLPLLKQAKKNLKIPVLYNCNGYERVEAIRALEGLVDVYLPDLKYGEENSGQKFSGVPDYFEYATKAVRAMFEQVGPPVLSSEGIMQRGLLIRHLVLPGQLEGTKRVLDWIRANIPLEVPLSLMSQYTPLFRAKDHPPLDRGLTPAEYEEAMDYFEEIGLENGFLQELEAAGSEEIPSFDGSGI